MTPTRGRLALLAVIILAGRMMAYYDEWFDCDRQPHSAFVDVVAGSLFLSSNSVANFSVSV